MKDVEHEGYCPNRVNWDNPVNRSRKLKPSNTQSSPTPMPSPPTNRPSSSKVGAASSPMSRRGGHGLYSFIKKGFTTLFGCMRSAHGDVYEHHERLRKFMRYKKSTSLV